MKDLFADGELAEEATCKEHLPVRREGQRQVSRSVRHYNLDAILAVDFRVRRQRRRARPSPAWAYRASARAAWCARAELEYTRYHALVAGQPDAVDAAFEKVAKRHKKPAAPRSKKGKKA